LRGSRHPALTAYTLKLVRLGERGRTGVMTARSRLLRAFIKEAARDGSRDTEQASAEFDKAWSGALRIVAATPTADVADGVWPSPNEPRVVARRLHVECEQERPVRFWKERWTGWTGTRWKLFSPSEFREKVYSALEDAVYLHGSKNEVVRKPWNPDDGKVSKVVDAMKGVAWLGGDVDAPSWLDHRPDNPLGVIACANGLLRVTDGVLLPHTPQFFNLVAVPFDYDADAPQPKMWLRFLDEVFPRDPAAVTALQEWFGYIVSGRTDQHKMLMVIGPPRSGKGTITNVLEQLVGRENAASPSTDDLSKSGGFGLQALIGKSLATIADGRVSINGKKLVENLLRISGGDSVQIDVKYHEPWVGKLPTRLMFMSNEAPALPDNSAAVISRLIALEMTQSFLGREDVDLGRKLTMELPGILLWALDGLRSLDARGHFVQPESGGELAGMLSESASPMAQFVEERCVFGDKEVCSSSDLFSFWRHWCDENGHQAGSSTKMGRDLHAWLRSTGLSRSVQRKKRGPRGGQSWHYLGMGFANESSNATIDGGRVKTSRIKRRAGAR
ncbi:MAG: phage/plasmid primase, P4 family, partial [Rhodococcus sp. (in: high G+C Gram-positive bacteria)]